MYSEGFDQVDGSTTRAYNEGDGRPTRDPLPRPAPARQRSLCSGAYAHPSLADLLRAKSKRCRVTAHSSASNDTSGTVYNQ